jgi:hypothetical protein
LREPEADDARNDQQRCGYRPSDGASHGMPPSKPPAGLPRISHLRAGRPTRKAGPYGFANHAVSKRILKPRSNA